MEEKLYFRPADYGKGKKKAKSTEKAKTDNSESKSHRARNLILFLLFLVIIVLIILWLLRGQTTTSGHFPENVKTESLTCTSTELTPPKLSGAVSSNKEVKINAIFRGDAELKTLSLIYTLNYASPDDAYGYEAKSHAEFNQALAASGYSVSKFSNKFSRYDNRLIISLSTNADEIDQISAPYFMLGVGDNGGVAKTLPEFKQNYETQGFICEPTTDK